MFKDGISNTMGLNKWMLLLVPITSLWGQHGAHTHGEAELNLILNSHREVVAELIVPAESVYGFEHAPRNAKESEQMEEGLKRLKASLSNIVAFEKQAGCQITEMDGEKSTGSHENHEPHGQGEHTDKAHRHHGEKPQEHQNHHNVMIRWRVLCGVDLKDKNMVVNWSEALPSIHHIQLTLLTPNRQEAISLRRSGEKIRI